ncbi:MAG: sigma-54-dependent Fis family transcriptional regulator [Myxococcales bacterium]|nr:sigma-54-dependent Fis family transcriptional regulator [Myxococcales bacterium]
MIIAVDDQAEVRELVEELFSARGQRVRTFSDGEAALSCLAENRADVDLVLLDLDLGPAARGGLSLLEEIRERDEELPVIILTGKGTMESAVAAMKAGASDFIEKDPYLEDKIELSLGKIERVLAALRERDALAEKSRDLQQRVDSLMADVEARYRIVGESGSLRGVLERALRVAQLPRPVLILGERGTGKELVAHAIHQASPRASGAFVVMNCAAVTETLLESELFGHEKGAFTGATQRKQGKFELADGGTLFLDEIGNMSLEFQVKILRVLEYQRFARVAGSRELSVDVRVIAATNANLERAMSEGTFRRDLYDRLAFEVIRLPPLRERPGDIAVLAQHFVDRFRREVGGVRCRTVGDAAVAALCAYAFPGNVRELKNVVERAAYAAEGDVLGAAEVEAALPTGGGPVVSASADEGDFTTQIEGFERRLLTDALGRTEWNQKEAAALLGLSYDQFRHLYRKYELSKLRG